MKSIAFIGTIGVSDEIRLGLAARELAKLGYRTVFEDIRTAARLNLLEYNVLVFNRPVPPTQKFLDIARRNGIKVIIDQDDYFPAIPAHHVAYKSIGPGNPGYIK